MTTGTSTTKESLSKLLQSKDENLDDAKILNLDDLKTVFQKQKELSNNLYKEKERLDHLIPTSQKINSQKIAEIKRLKSKTELQYNELVRIEDKDKVLDRKIDETSRDIEKNRTQRHNLESRIKDDKERLKSKEDEKYNKGDRENKSRDSYRYGYDNTLNRHSLGNEITQLKRKIRYNTDKADKLRREKDVLVKSRDEDQKRRESGSVNLINFDEIKLLQSTIDTELKKMLNTQSKLNKFKGVLKEEGSKIKSLVLDIELEIEKIADEKNVNSRSNVNQQVPYIERGDRDASSIAHNEKRNEFDSSLEASNHAFNKIRNIIDELDKSIEEFSDELTDIYESSISHSLRTILKESRFLNHGSKNKNENHDLKSSSYIRRDYSSEPVIHDMDSEYYSSLSPNKNTIPLSDSSSMIPLSKSMTPLGTSKTFLDSKSSDVDDGRIEDKKRELEKRQEDLARREKEIAEQEKINPECKTFKESIMRRTSLSFNNKILLRVTAKLNHFNENLILFQDKVIKKGEGYIDAAIEKFDKAIQALEKKRDSGLAEFEEKLQADLNEKFKDDESMDSGQKKELVDEMARLIEEEEEKMRAKLEERKEQLFLDLHRYIVNIINGIARTYRHMHFDFIGKTVRRRMYYIDRWRNDPSLNSDIDEFRDELGNLDKAKYQISETARKFLVTDLVDLFDTKVDSLNMSRISLSAEKRTKILSDQNDTRIDARDTFDTVFMYYNDQLQVADFLLDREFIVLYFLKVVNFTFLVFSLYITESLFNELYIKKVYRDKESPPRLIYLVLLCYGLHTIMNLVLVTILILMAYIFVENIHPFVINRTLLLHYLRDYAGTSLIHAGFCLLFAYIAEKKRYFRYQIEGLRTIRGLSEFILYLGVFFYVVPVFFVFWT